MIFAATTKRSLCAALALLSIGANASAEDGATEFASITVTGVPDIQIKYDPVSSVHLPANKALAALVTLRIADGRLQLSCEENCARLRDVPVEIALPNLKGLQVNNGGQIRVVSRFPLVDTLTVKLGNGAEVDASGLPALDASVETGNGGKLRLTVCDRLHAKLANGGEVVFDGSPEVDAQPRNGGVVRQSDPMPSACQHTIDERDHRRYATVKMGSQEWFAENLAWLPRVCELNNSECGVWVYGHDDSDARAARSTRNFQDFGALYSWNVAQQACPQGWRLPSDADWQTLEENLGLTKEELGQTIWRGPSIADALKLGGDSQLQVKLAGWRSGDGQYLYIGEHANFWTATPAHQNHAIERLIGRTKQQIGRHTGNQSCGFSVRCVRDISTKLH